MPKLSVNRFLQGPGCCAIAASACVANYWDESKDYEYAKSITYKKILKNEKEKGLYTGQICLLLNELGFHKVTMISSAMDVFDYQWQKFKRAKMIKTLVESLKNKKCIEEKRQTRPILKWLKNYDYDNNLILDYNFGKYIRSSIRAKKPVIISFNWTMFFKYHKLNEKGYEDIYNGSPEMHAAVVYGYDTKGVHICDSHNILYTYKRKKYRSGYYKISWENLMSVIGEGDVLLVDKYEK